jgi:hypothetical protein
MAEFLLRVVDKVNTDPVLNTKCTKRGDVIVVQEDGWAWGLRELTDPQYRLLRVPAMSLSEARTFVAEEQDVNPQAPSRMLLRRAFKLDIDHPIVPIPVKAWLADATRATPLLVLNLNISIVRGLKVLKPSIPDPQIIG